MKRRNTAGYTILEVMIVLGVTGALFLSATLMFSGRQARTQFEQAVRDLESQLQSIASDVASGYFPASLTCSVPATGAVGIGGASSITGSNTGCVFLGKVAAFDASDKINIVNLVGRQYVGAVGSATVSTLSEAFPIADTNSVINYRYKYGLAPLKIYDMSDDVTAFGAIMFVSKLGGGSGASSPLTGSGNLLLYGLDSSSFADNIANTASKVNTATSAANFKALPKGVKVCLLGGNGQRAEITIGADGSQVSTNVTIDTGISNACQNA